MPTMRGTNWKFVKSSTPQFQENNKFPLDILFVYFETDSRQKIQCKHLCYCKHELHELSTQDLLTALREQT